MACLYNPFGHGAVSTSYAPLLCLGSKNWDVAVSSANLVISGRLVHASKHSAEVWVAPYAFRTDTAFEKMPKISVTLGNSCPIVRDQRTVQPILVDAVAASHAAMGVATVTEIPGERRISSALVKRMVNEQFHWKSTKL